MQSQPLLRLLRIGVGAGGGSAEEESFPIGGVDQIDSARFVGAILRLISVDNDLGSYGQRLLCVAQADQGIWTATLDHPGSEFAIVAFDVDVKPGVGIDQLHLG